MGKSFLTSSQQKLKGRDNWLCLFSLGNFIYLLLTTQLLMIFRFEGTLERFAGDGLMVFFNDPVPCPDPAMRAVRMSLAVREDMGELRKKWQKRGHHLGMGMGIAQGFATLGRIGFEGRFDYGAIGTVTNLAARLSDEARDRQILIDQRVYAEVGGMVEVEPMGELSLKGLHRPVTVYNVLGLK
jgi:class 3 adenylate cyclase